MRCTIYVAKIKALMSCAVNAHCYRICKNRLSHDAVHMVLDVYFTFQVFLNISMGCDETSDTQDLSADLL